MSQPDLREAIRLEFIKCAQDPAHFMKKYCYIQHPQKGRITFNLYPFQGKVLNLWKENKYNIVLKSRQLGISTLGAGYSLWLMLFHKDKNVLCIATKQETAKNMVTKVRFMYEHLPSWLKVTADENNKLSLRLANGSQIKATSASSDAGRSEAVSLLLIDEAAFINNIGEIWASAQQTLATGGGCIALSTPYGTGNWFHKTWVAAELGENSFLPIRLPWQVHPERNQEWRDRQDADLGPRMAAQECFSGDVIVYTNNGPKHIEDIVVGDIVLSHDGTYNKVVRTFSHESTDVYSISSALNTNTKSVTGNHPFSVNGEWVKVKNIGNQPVDFYPSSNQHNQLTLEFTGTPTVVYNFEVENTHTYVTEYGIVHNCDCTFETSGDTVFYPEDIAFYEQSFIREPLEKRGIDQNLWIWEPADYSRNYLISADVARGDGKDYSTFHIIDVENFTQVGEYRGQLGTKEFGYLLVGIATEYNNALLSIENSSIGWSTVQTVIERGYQNLYHTPRGSVASSFFDPFMDTNKMTAGFSLTQATRPIAIGKFQEAVTDKSAIVYSARLLEEMKVFIWKNGRPEAQTGYNDDLIMAFAVACYLRETSFKMRQQGMDMSRSILNSMSTSTNPYAGGYSTNNNPNPYNVQNPYGGNEDISWLL